MTRIVTTEAHLALDYPKLNELITSSHYTLRFTASDETEAVEVSIDGGPWQYCRRTAGYFWFDWTNYMSGRHEIRARARVRGGLMEETDARLVRVELQK